MIYLIRISGFMSFISLIIMMIRIRTLFKVASMNMKNQGGSYYSYEEYEKWASEDFKAYDGNDFKDIFEEKMRARMWDEKSLDIDIPNRYKVLGFYVYPSSSDEIKKKYRKLVMELHPDRNNNDPEKIKLLQEITRAYRLCMDDFEKV